MEKWICTDPATGQFRLDDGSDVWTARVFTFQEGEVRETINLDNYDAEDVNDMIGAYGYYLRLDGLYFDCSGNSVSNDVIAECIFETENS